MEKNIPIEEVAEKISDLKYDIRAEVVINELINNRYLKPDQYIITKEGQFSRTYRHDILEADVVDYNLDDKQFVNFYLSRDSWYDMLPEGVTHNSKNDTPGKDVDSMIKEYQLQKRQQKGARTFFQPFENELFSVGVETEKFERDFLFELNGYLVPEMFYEFWGIPKDMLPVLISKFIRILPYAYKIVGNIELACNILSKLLEEKVTVSYKNHHKYYDESQGISLGDCALGLDFITGTSYDDYSSHLDINIGPLQNTPFREYIHSGKIKAFLDIYYQHFFPLEVEINTVILLKEEQQEFKFTTVEETILGYNTRI